MKLSVILMVVFLHFHFLLLASKCSTLEIQVHSSIKETEAEDGQEPHIASLSKKGGRGGGGRGGGGRGGGRMLPFYGAAGAAGAAAAHGSRSHHRGSTCRTARFGWTLPSFLIGLGICLMQF